MLRTLRMIVLLSLLSGCMSLTGTGAARHVYVLNDKPAARLPAHNKQPQVLMVESTYSTSYDDSIHLVYSRRPNTRGRYQYAQWSELPSSRMTELLFSRLSEASIYRTVLNARSDADADHTLSTELLDCYHDAARSPGEAVIRLRAELYNQHTHRLIARKVFTVRASLSQYDAASAAAAFNQAEQQLLNEISEWLMHEQA
ncbi:MAG: ABC-type transport auxiliary lipoprotein family protein [Betaproteobacteria bacterium]|nr:ABC-type transport auxiliary lipoprotein family protein [Betaproteobacteria bacterium]